VITDITCEYIASARPIEKAITAELMTKSLRKPTRCDKCEKFHVWVEVSRLEWVGVAAARERITADYYTQVGPNAFLHINPRQRKSKAKGGKDTEDG